MKELIIVIEMTYPTLPAASFAAFYPSVKKMKSSSNNEYVVELIEFEVIKRESEKVMRAVSPRNDTYGMMIKVTAVPYIDET